MCHYSSSFISFYPIALFCYHVFISNFEGIHSCIYDMTPHRTALHRTAPHCIAFTLSHTSSCSSNRIHNNLLPCTLLNRPAHCTSNNTRGQMKRFTAFTGTGTRTRACCCTYCCSCTHPCPCPCPGPLRFSCPPTTRARGTPGSVWALSPTPFVSSLEIRALRADNVTNKSVCV